MKTPILNTACTLLIFAALSSCNKIGTAESAKYENAVAQSDSSSASDSISSVATLQVKDKQFIKSADVNMEVKDVYETTIFLEKSLKDLGGFVTSSNLNSNILSEKTFAVSDEKAMMVRKFQTENKMEVRIPTEKLGDFLQTINEKKVFLNSRIILAEDVTSNIKLAKLEKERNKNTEKNISKLNLNKDKVKMTDENQSENNYQQVADFDMKDQLAYSTVQLFLTEPEVRVAQIAVSNTQNLENQSNFFYDLKNAFSDGFHLIKQIIIGLFGIWPLIFIGIIAFFLYKRKKTLKIVTADKN